MTLHIGPGWTDARIEYLKQLWSDGLSASQIAAELGGTTRNAVCGKVDRLGLEGRTNSSFFRDPKPKHKPRRIGGNRARKDPALLQRLRTMPSTEEIEAMDLPADTSPDACSILDLTDTTCRWPLGLPAHDMQYCGSPKLDCGVYCARHHRLAHHPMGQRRA